MRWFRLRGGRRRTKEFSRQEIDEVIPLLALMALKADNDNCELAATYLDYYMMKEGPISEAMFDEESRYGKAVKDEGKRTGRARRTTS